MIRQVWISPDNRDASTGRDKHVLPLFASLALSRIQWHKMDLFLKWKQWRGKQPAAVKTLTCQVRKYDLNTSWVKAQCVECGQIQSRPSLYFLLSFHLFGKVGHRNSLVSPRHSLLQPPWSKYMNLKLSPFNFNEDAYSLLNTALSSLSFISSFSCFLIYFPGAKTHH